MNLMIQPNQICLIVKLYNNRPELLPGSNVFPYLVYFLWKQPHNVPIPFIAQVAKLFIFDKSVLHYLRAMTFKSMPGLFHL